MSILTLNSSKKYSCSVSPIKPKGKLLKLPLTNNLWNFSKGDFNPHQVIVNPHQVIVNPHQVIVNPHQVIVNPHQVIVNLFMTQDLFDFIYFFYFFILS
jgi:hypothetical protein